MSTKGTSRVMLAIGSSRILGLVREILLNTFLGAGKELDALIAAFRIPNLLRDLFAEGALSTAFVTTFSEGKSVDGPCTSSVSKMAASGVTFERSLFSLGIRFG